jgi:hypothetical protein
MQRAGPLKWLPPSDCCREPPPPPELFGSPALAAFTMHAPFTAAQLSGIAQLSWQGEAVAAQTPAAASWQLPTASPQVAPATATYSGHLREQTQLMDRCKQEQQVQQPQLDEQQLWQAVDPPSATPQQPQPLPCSPALLPAAACRSTAAAVGVPLPELQAVLQAAVAGGSSPHGSSPHAGSHSPTETAALRRTSSLGCAASDAAWAAGDSDSRSQPMVCLHATRSGELSAVSCSTDWLLGRILARMHCNAGHTNSTNKLSHTRLPMCSPSVCGPAEDAAALDAGAARALLRSCAAAGGPRAGHT